MTTGGLLRAVASLVILAILLGYVPAPDSESAGAPVKTSPKVAAQEPEELYLVKRVVDGDTIELLGKNDGTFVVRLIGIDTPEEYTLRGIKECYADAATDRVRSLLYDGSVALEKDGSQGRVDVYGRTLAYAYTKDGRMLNRVLLEEGYAREYTHIYPYKYQKGFQDAENYARERGLGLWSACHEADSN